MPSKTWVIARLAPQRTLSHATLPAGQREIPFRLTPMEKRIQEGGDARVQGELQQRQ